MFKLGIQSTFLLIVLTSMTILHSVSAQEIDVESALEDFIHYTLVANVDDAEDYATILIRSDMIDVEFYKMVTETKERHDRFDRAIGWAMFVPELERFAAKLEERFENGRTALIRNASRLRESIGLLNGTTRQRILAEKRLQEAGEYAVPILLETLISSNDARTARMVRDMLVSIQRDAVLPLVIALPHLDKSSKIVVIKALGDIGYAHAGPALATLLQDESQSPSVHGAAKRALSQLGISQSADLSVLNNVVSRQYFDGLQSVTPNAIGGINLFWKWGENNQLVPLDVPQEVFGDIMAMYFASQALEMNQENEDAMSVFVAANLRRDRKLAGQDDDVYGDLPYSPEFYATVFGPNVAQLVLDDALNRGDTTLMLEAIAALADTAGAESLLSGEKPLMKAMFYPDRRVQYEAALVLASTLPKESFTGSYRVVPLLASAVRTQGDLFAIVIGDNADERRAMATFLNKNGWIVVGQGVTADEAVQAAGVVPGFDLAVVLSMNAEKGVAMAASIAELPDTTVTPTFVLTSGGDAEVLANAIGSNDMVETANAAISDEAKLGEIEDLLAKASGGLLGYEEQVAFSNRALEVLRSIALADTVLEVDDATGTLIDALTNETDLDSQTMISQTLAMIDDVLAQRALINVALADGNDVQRVMFLDEASASVRRWGNHAQDWHIEMVVDLAENANGNLADAAARLNGALDHPNTSVMMFLPE